MNLKTCHDFSSQNTCYHKIYEDFSYSKGVSLSWKIQFWEALSNRAPPPSSCILQDVLGRRVVIYVCLIGGKSSFQTFHYLLMYTIGELRRGRTKSKLLLILSILSVVFSNFRKNKTLLLTYIILFVCLFNFVYAIILLSLFAWWESVGIT